MNQMDAQTKTSSEQITLYYREGGSDKVYQATIEPAGEQFVVNFAFGRRGATLTTGTKTKVPLDYDQAKHIFDKLGREKMAKGYTPGADGTPYQNTSQENRVTGLLPQLLNPIDENRVQQLIVDPAWCMQEKIDGRRVLIAKSEERIVGINRKGLAISLPTTITVVVASIAGDFTLDGECVGDHFHVFDLLALNGIELRSLPYVERWHLLGTLLESKRSKYIVWIDTAFSQEHKAQMLDELRVLKAEGVVFKRLDAPYTPGRPSSGGTQLKHKFYATLSAVVSNQNDKRSVEFKLQGNDGWHVAGNVTIPGNQEIPNPGDVIEVRYLYAFPGSGILYQPVYLGVRSDIDQKECRTTQLKFKPTEENDEEN